MPYARVLILPALLLSACSQPDTDTKLARRPGLWEASNVTIIQGRKSLPQVSQFCIDAETDHAMQAYSLGLIQSKCDRTVWRVGRNRHVLEAACKAGSQPFKVYGEATGSFEADYTTTLTLTRVGTPAFPTMPPEMTVVSVAKWVGACKPTQKPGDMTLADGTRMNIRSVPGVASLLQSQPAPAASAPVPATLPTRKAGLWELRSTFADNALPPQAQMQCVAAEVDADLTMAASNDPAASCTQTVGRDGSTYVVSGKCVGRITTLARAVITGSFEGTLTAHITVQREDGEPLGPGLPSQIAARQNQRWLSACTSDMQPGDIVMADGSRRNVRELRKKQ